MRSFVLIPAFASGLMTSTSFAADMHGRPYSQYSSETTVMREAAPPPPPVVVKRTVTTTTTTTYRSAAHGTGYAETEYKVAPPRPRVRYSETRFVPAPIEAAPIYHRLHRPWWARHPGHHRHPMY